MIEQAKDAVVYPSTSYIYLHLLSRPAGPLRPPLDLQISCQGLDWQVSHLAEVLSQSSALLNVHHLSILRHSLLRRRQGELDDIEWLALFRQFTALETLCVFHEQAGHVAHALDDVTVEMVPEILPALRLLFLKGVPAGCVKKFITARQLAGLPPIVIANTQDEYESKRSPPPP
jgi:hypothetical protein